MARWWSDPEAVDFEGTGGICPLETERNLGRVVFDTRRPIRATRGLVFPFSAAAGTQPSAREKITPNYKIAGHGYESIAVRRVRA